MPDIDNTSFAGLAWTEYLARVEHTLDEDDHLQPLGADHAAILRDRNPGTLLVSFEQHDRLSTLSKSVRPVGWQMVQNLNWSHLCLMSRTDTWFRDRAVYAYFDRLTDDGFFDDYDRVVFYGAGPCGYAAAAFSVAAPGARVLLLEPQATLEPEVTEWEHRYPEMRRVSFSDRYGYAPDMLDAAKQAVVLYDPLNTVDAMHATLFTLPNVMKFRMRHMGSHLERDLLRMKLLLRMLAQVSSDKLTRHSLSRLFRARQLDETYQDRLLEELTIEGRDGLILNLTNEVLRQRKSHRHIIARQHARQKRDATVTA